jgi:Pin2-interacting protein X1
MVKLTRERAALSVRGRVRMCARRLQKRESRRNRGSGRGRSRKSKKQNQRRRKNPTPRRARRAQRQLSSPTVSAHLPVERKFSLPHRATVPQYAPPRHRARAIASKNMASASATALSEILGVVPTPQTSSKSSSPKASTPDVVTPEHEKISTSTLSVADYFKNRLASKATSAPSASGCRTAQ